MKKEEKVWKMLKSIAVEACKKQNKLRKKVLEFPFVKQGVIKELNAIRKNTSQLNQLFYEMIDVRCKDEMTHHTHDRHNHVDPTSLRSWFNEAITRMINVVDDYRKSNKTKGK